MNRTLCAVVPSNSEFLSRWASNRSEPFEWTRQSRGGGADLCVRSAGRLSGDHRSDGQRTHLDRLSPRPLGVHSSTPSAWGQRQGGGGADLCVRSAGRLSEDTAPMGREQTWIGPAPVRWASIRAHSAPWASDRVAGGRTSVSAPFDFRR